MNNAQEDNFMYQYNNNCDKDLFQAYLSDLEEGYMSGETICDSRSESDFSEIGNLDIASDSALFDTYFSLDNIFGSEEPDAKFDNNIKNQESCPSSPFDTKNFPTSVNDISRMILDMEPLISFDMPLSNSFTPLDSNIIDSSKCHTDYKPVIKVEVVADDYKQEDTGVKMESNEEISNTTHLLPPKRRRHQNRKYSSTDTDSDEEWAPDEYSYKHDETRYSSQRKRRMSNSKRNPRPIPQRRAPGTKQKITQWIVSLLRDPRYNPKVITWLDETKGIFHIKNTNTFAKLWGIVKHNENMNYEKLSRAMRYSYQNNELQMVPEQRLTYKFGPNMLDCRALDSQDPNFQKLHEKH